MKKFIVLGLVLYSISSSLGLFLSQDPFGLTMMFWLCGISFSSHSPFFIPSYISPDQLKAFPFITLGVILLNFVVQITGGIHSSLWPAYFLFAVLVAAFSPPSRTYAVTTLILGIETANLLAPKHVQDFRWEAYAGYALTLVIVSAATTHIMHRRIQENKQVKDAHERLIASATAVDTLRDETKLAALTNERRQAANLNTVMKREITFNGLIDMIYAFVPAHTYALYLKERVNEDHGLCAQGYPQRFGRALSVQGRRYIDPREASWARTCNTRSRKIWIRCPRNWATTRRPCRYGPRLRSPLSRMRTPSACSWSTVSRKAPSRLRPRTCCPASRRSSSRSSTRSGSPGN